MHLTPWVDGPAGDPTTGLQYALAQGGGGIILARAASIDALPRMLNAGGTDAHAAQRQGRRVNARRS